MAFTYITLSGGTKSIKIPLNNYPSVSGADKNIWIMKDGITGLFDAGENNSAAMPMLYSNGSVLDPNPTYSGKSISLDIVIGGLSHTAANHIAYRQKFEKLIDVIKNGNIGITSDYSFNFTAQVMDAFLQDGAMGPDVYQVQVSFVTKEAW